MFKVLVVFMAVLTCRQAFSQATSSFNMIPKPISIGGYASVQKVYSYEPVPPVLNTEQKKHILGAQANVWTEYMDNPRKVEYMIFPRLSALSEVLWSRAKPRTWSEFEKRLAVQFRRYDLWGVSYSRTCILI